MIASQHSYRIGSTQKRFFVFAVAVLFFSLIPLALAQNARSVLPITVAPLNAQGALTPNATYHYNFVFATSVSCTSLLNVSVDITTNARGIGSTELNIGALSTTPNYICEYVNGTLRKTHPVFSSLFENRTADADILTFGYNHTSALDTYFVRNLTAWTICSGGQYSVWNGTGFACAVDQTGAAGNSSWNQSYANTLYAPISTVSYNTSWNQSFANTLYASISVTGDNSSWNQSKANALYYPLSTNPLAYYNSTTFTNYYPLLTNPLGYYNSSTLPAQGGDNASWNKTYADTLYAAIGAAGNNSWNQTYANTLYLGINDQRYNETTRINNLNTTANIQVLGFNTTTQLNTLYAPISVTGDNTSWNKTYADSLYYNKSNTLGYYNSTTFTNYYPLLTNPLGYYNSSTLPASGDNTSWNKTYADTLYAAIGAAGNASFNQTLTDASYYPKTTNPLAYYNSTTFTNYYPLLTNPLAYYNSTTLPAYPTADNTSWNQTKANALYYPLTTNTLGYYNSSTFTNYYPLLSNPLGYYNSSTLPASGDNTSWNKTYADTLYAPITVISDNSSWNKTYADTIYYNKSNILGYYNSSTFTNYYPLLTNPLAYYNSSTLPAYPTADNASWNQTYADTLYARNASIPTCSGTDKLTSAGNGVFTCTPDQTGAGLIYQNGTDIVINGTLRVLGAAYENYNIEAISSTTYYCGFMAIWNAGMCYPNYAGTSVGTGTSTTAPATPNHPGSVNILSTTAVNTGYAYTTSTSAFLLNGSEEFRGSLNVTNDTFTNRSYIKFGFLDVITNIPVQDGVFFEINTNSTGVFIAGVTANNSAYNYTANYTVTQPGVLKGGEYLTYQLIINPSASNVTFYVYNDSATLLWNATLVRTAQLGIPTTPGRETGAGIIAVRNTTAGTARNIARIDYMVTELRSLGRPLG